MMKVDCTRQMAKLLVAQLHSLRPCLTRSAYSETSSLHTPSYQGCHQRQFIKRTGLCSQNTVPPTRRGQHRCLISSSVVRKDDKESPEAGNLTKVETIVKVQPTLKTKRKPKIDFSKSYYDNIFITPVRAMDEYLISISDLDTLTKNKRRSAYADSGVITVFLRREVEQKAIEVHGSLEALTKERQKRIARDHMQHAHLFNVKRARKEYLRQHADGKDEKPYLFNPPAPAPAPNSLFKHGSGKVVLYAITINAANCILKGGAWVYTGSHSMFSEFVHSMADTANQVLLAVGLHQSLKKPDLEHPYGWGSFNNVSSLISGVSIFCIGAGMSWYHGIMGLMHPTELTSLYWAILILVGAFFSEGATLFVAANQVKVNAKSENMSPLQYVMLGMDPTTNVVLLEDLGAVLGVLVAAGCMSITYLTGNPMADALGSLFIGTILGAVASFVIYTNTVALVGRSIPLGKKQNLMKELEGDRMIRALHDVKATEIGSSYVRFKAEVDFDGREVTRHYLEGLDLDQMLQEMQSLENIEALESFMLKHGDAIVDRLGGEVDRIEHTLKKKHPEIRHVDLEQL